MRSRHRDRAADFAARYVAANENERVAAAYRIIRTRLLHTIRTHNLRSLAITSPGPGEGKSVTSMNIALSLARDPTCSVFLLDLDMRNPSLCRYVGVQPPASSSAISQATSMRARCCSRSAFPTSQSPAA